jgi:stearoyl-CoA desaturase (delta-9 desaturase)
MNSARQGFFWWEVDISYYILKALSWMGMTWDPIQPPRRLLEVAPANVGSPAASPESIAQ